MSDDDRLYEHDIKIGEHVVAHISCSDKKKAINIAVSIATRLGDLTGLEVEITDVDKESCELLDDVPVEMIH
jgi:hypothetical protein